MRLSPGLYSVFTRALVPASCGTLLASVEPDASRLLPRDMPPQNFPKPSNPATTITLGFAVGIEGRRRKHAHAETGSDQAGESAYDRLS